jgi:hypothetical protein
VIGGKNVMPVARIRDQEGESKDDRGALILSGSDRCGSLFLISFTNSLGNFVVN